MLSLFWAIETENASCLLSLFYKSTVGTDCLIPPLWYCHNLLILNFSSNLYNFLSSVEHKIQCFVFVHTMKARYCVFWNHWFSLYTQYLILPKEERGWMDYDRIFRQTIFKYNRLLAAHHSLHFHTVLVLPDSRELSLVSKPTSVSIINKASDCRFCCRPTAAQSEIWWTLCQQNPKTD